MRMVIAYLFAQLIPEKYNIPSYLLVLASGNIDEALTGYLTKYDCSSGDLNLIGSINKVDVKAVIGYLFKMYPHLTALDDILKAKPSAELTPISGDKPSQSDEEDIGLTYEEIKIFNDLRNKEMCGIVSTYHGLCEIMPTVDPAIIKEKCQIFFKRYF